MYVSISVCLSLKSSYIWYGIGLMCYGIGLMCYGIDLMCYGIGLMCYGIGLISLKCYRQ